MVVLLYRLLSINSKLSTRFDNFSTYFCVIPQILFYLNDDDNDDDDDDDDDNDNKDVYFIRHQPYFIENKIIKHYNLHKIELKYKGESYNARYKLICMSTTIEL